jgi:hypothetical protein
MATFFRNKVIKDLSTLSTHMVETTAASRVTVIGLSVTNLTSAVIKVSITLTDNTSTTGYFIKDVTIPANQSLRVINGGEKLVMAENNLLAASADRENAADVIVSYVEIV